MREYALEGSREERTARSNEMEIFLQCEDPADAARRYLSTWGRLDILGARLGLQPNAPKFYAALEVLMDARARSLTRAGVTPGHAREYLDEQGICDHLDLLLLRPDAERAIDYEVARRLATPP